MTLNGCVLPSKVRIGIGDVEIREGGRGERRSRSSKKRPNDVRDQKAWNTIQNNVVKGRQDLERPGDSNECAGAVVACCSLMRGLRPFAQPSRRDLNTLRFSAQIDPEKRLKLHLERPRYWNMWTLRFGKLYSVPWKNMTCDSRLPTAAYLRSVRWVDDFVLNWPCTTTRWNAQRSLPHFTLHNTPWMQPMKRLQSVNGQQLW